MPDAEKGLDVVYDSFKQVSKPWRSEPEIAGFVEEFFVEIHAESGECKCPERNCSIIYTPSKRFYHFNSSLLLFFALVSQPLFLSQSFELCL